MSVVRREPWLYAGLLCTASATLLLEVLDSRLLSVLTWYHLSFFAVSMAMLGMAAGAVIVFLGGDAFRGPRAATTMARAAVAFAIVVPISHIYVLAIPLPLTDTGTVMALAAFAMATLALAAPFLLSGIVLTLALTRVGGQPGRLYGWDLLGAAAGALLVIPLLDALNISSVVFVAGAAAALGAWCFSRFAGAGSGAVAIGVVAVLVLAAIANGNGVRGVTVRYSKNNILPPASSIETARWNSHSFIMVHAPAEAPPFYWGAGALAVTDPVTMAYMVIDGDAATAITKWDGDRSHLEWVKHDVTNLPHYLRHGDAAVIGVGGGRDVLSALWAGNTHVTAIELNASLLDTIRVSHRNFAGIANDPAVTFVFDEARSYLSRTDQRFDVLQMSLIDTWAATGAGAFTLSENGLYTLEGWRVFLSVLKPNGIFSVSRWFSPSRSSETNRLLSLAVAALIDRGVARPLDHLALVARDRIATILVSPSPLTTADRETIARVSTDEEFTILAAPSVTSGNARLDGIARSRTGADLTAATDDAVFDYSAPTDQRPYFFNILKLRSFANFSEFRDNGIAWGNVGATTTLVALGVIAAVLVIAIVVLPLVIAGRPAMPPRAFAAAVTYFAVIGFAYMLIQIAFLQRFSILLGHPTYSFSIILFSMILFTGAGSFLSDRLAIGGRARGRWLPVTIAAAVLLTMFLLSPVIAVAIRLSLPGRTMVVLAFTGPLSLLLGCCFPVGVRLVGRLSDHAAAWMWGVNGACGVLASVAAVIVSMSAGIDTNLMIAAGLYLLLALPMRALFSACR